MDLDSKKVYVFTEENELEKCIDAYDVKKGVLFGVYFYKEDETFDSDYHFRIGNLTPIDNDGIELGELDIEIDIWNPEPRKTVSALYISQFLEAMDKFKELKKALPNFKADLIFYTMNSTFSFTLKDLDDETYKKVLEIAEEKGELVKQEIEFMRRMNEKLESKFYRISDDECIELEVLLKQYPCEL